MRKRELIIDLLNLPEFDCYIEVKGYWRDDAKKKFNLFINKYKNIDIKVFDGTTLKQLGIVYE